ncbi:hypothetical protein QQX98_012042 [Neonectria punicea]|uniref:HNH nuclease domain-containing protein n=1 Tax=Neonectria punicea TaxID=979145 RepID=A0ABR1GJY2_9HYPO
MPETPKTPKTPKTPRQNASRELAESPVDLANSPVTCFSSQVMKSMPTTLYYEKLGDVIVKSKQAKRNFSDVSAASEDKIQKAKASEDFDDDEAGLSRLIHNEVKKKIEAMTETIRAELDNANEHVHFLNSIFHNGEIHIETQHFTKEVDKFEMSVLTHRANLAILQSQKNQIIGEYLDDMNTQLANKHHDDWAYIDLVISRLQAPDGAKLTLFKSRDDKSQSRFRQAVLSSYDAEAGWCCLEGSYFMAKYVTAAHIVPYNIGEVNAEYLFGPTTEKEGHLMSPHNGIPMLKMHEYALDKGLIALVPVPDSNDVRIILFDTPGENIPDSLKKLHGNILSFRNDFRPSKRYLYFLYVTTLLRRQRHEAPKWWKSISQDTHSTMWATPGEYLRRSSLLVLARNIGHLPPDEATELINNGQTPAPLADDDTNNVRNNEISAGITMRPGPSSKRAFCNAPRSPKKTWSLANRSVSKGFGVLVDYDEEDDEEEVDEDEDDEEENNEEENNEKNDEGGCKGDNKDKGYGQ